MRAWAAYGAAEAIFHELRDWPWLGTVHQEQAICLHQAEREGVGLVADQRALAERLIERALDICRESAVRSYPSALNRAGRIFGTTDVDRGIRHLDEGVTQAHRIGDGWFYSANLMEYLELNYRAWTSGGGPAYRRAITDRSARVVDAIATYAFPDLAARWELLQGHLLTHDALDGLPGSDLDEAVEHYASGFRKLADERVGSHGSAAIAREFVKFHAMFDRLPADVQRRWYGRLSEAWSAPDAGEPSTSLLARLEELY